MCAFSRRIPAQEALNNFHESIIKKLDNEGISYVKAISWDTQKVKSASADYNRANKISIKALNKDLWEPTELVLFPGGVYEFTANDQRRGFSQ